MSKYTKEDLADLCTLAGNVKDRAQTTFESMVISSEALTEHHSHMLDMAASVLHRKIVALMKTPTLTPTRISPVETSGEKGES